MADMPVSLPNEIWKREASGIEGVWLSSEGRVWRETRRVPRGIRKDGVVAYAIKRGRILSPIKNPQGYEILLLGNPGQKRKNYRVHRMVCAAFHGPAPTPAHVVAHGDNRPSNNRASNLRWATHSENREDMHRHGTSFVGSRHPAHKLVEADVIAIRHACELGRGRRTVAAEYNVSESTVGYIMVRKTWRHI